MNTLVADYAKKNGMLTVTQACEKYSTTKDKIKGFVTGGLLEWHTTPLDRRVKLLKEKELKRVLRGAENNGTGEKKK